MLSLSWSYFLYRLLPVFLQSLKLLNSEKNSKTRSQGARCRDRTKRSCRLTHGLGLLSFDNCWVLTAIISETSMIDDSVNGRNPAPAADMENLSIFSSWVHIYIYVYIYTNWYKISSINSWTPICSAQGHHPANQLVAFQPSALTRFYEPPGTHQPPCLPWHKMAHGDDIRPHGFLLKQPTADLLRTIKLWPPHFTLMPSFKGNKWLHLSHGMCLQIVMLKILEVVSNGFRSVSRYFVDVWLT